MIAILPLLKEIEIPLTVKGTKYYIKIHKNATFHFHPFHCRQLQKFISFILLSKLLCVKSIVYRNESLRQNFLLFYYAEICRNQHEFDKCQTAFCFNRTVLIEISLYNTLKMLSERLCFGN